MLSPFVELKNIMVKVVIFWPTTEFGNCLRNRFYKKHLKSLGTNTLFESGVRFGGPNSIDIGNNCIFGRNVNINAGDCHGVFIGNYVAIADGTYLRSSNHSFDNIDVPIQLQGHATKKIEYRDKAYSVIIEDDVWIGARVIILSGAKIGTGSIISAGSVVASEIPPFSIAVGNPARVIGNRKKRISTTNE